MLKTRFCALLILAALGTVATDALSQTGSIVRRELPNPTVRFPSGKEVVEIPFEVGGTWMVIPVSVNGSRPLRYVLDTGASGAIHYNQAIVDALNLKVTGKMQVRGAGGSGAPVEVSLAENVTFNIGGVELQEGSLALRSSQSGHDGVIGGPIFANLVVEVDWEKQRIRFYDPAKYKYSGSGIVLPLTFDEGGRPYAMAMISVSDEKGIPVKLVVDTGGRHNLVLDVGSNSEIKIPEGATKTIIGRGASGEITGYLGRTKVLEFGGQKFKDVPTLFPDASSGTAGLNGRQGNLGSGILRRCKIIFDYSRKQMIVEPNKFSSEPFAEPKRSIAANTMSVVPATLQDSAGKNGNKEISIKELSDFLEQSVAADAFSGVVLIARNDEVIFKKAYGMANKSTNTPNSVDTKINLGSMNKMFTAVAIAQLVERGKLSFADTVGKLLPDYPNKQVAEKVTIHQLLTHTSGMGDYFNATFFANLDRLKTVADLLPLFADDSLKFEPGTKFQYSNAGYVLLGRIIEKVSGQDYFAYVKEHIFKPAGMVNTDSFERDNKVSDMALGYMRMNDKGMADPSAPLRENTSVLPGKGSPAGGGYSTAEDMLKFSLALYAHKLLSQKYTEIVTTGKIETGGPGRKYAYGFGDNVIDGRRVVGHNGGGPGIGANFDIFPENGYTAVVLSNYSAPTMMPVVKKVRELIATLSQTATKSP